MAKIANKNVMDSISYLLDFQGSNLKGESVKSERKPGVCVVYKIVSYFTEVAQFVTIFDEDLKPVEKCWIVEDTFFSRTTSKQMTQCGLGKQNRKAGFCNNGYKIVSKYKLLPLVESSILKNLLPDNGSEDRQAVRL